MLTQFLKWNIKYNFAENLWLTNPIQCNVQQETVTVTLPSDRGFRKFI